MYTAFLDPTHPEPGQVMTWRTAAIVMMAALQPASSGSSAVIQADGSVWNAQRGIYPADTYSVGFPWGIP